MNNGAPSVLSSRRWTATFTQRLLQLRPSREDLVDAAFVAMLIVLGITGFASTFSSHRYLLVGAVGVVLGLALAHLVQSLRWPWLSTVALTIAAFVLLGGAIALRSSIAEASLPTPRVIKLLLELAVHGWKAILTTLPPVDGSGEYLVIPYLMALFTSAAAYEISRRNRAALPALAVPFLVFVAVLLLGTQDPVAATIRGLGLAVLGFAWLVVRWRRRIRVRTVGRAGWVPRLTAGALALAAVGGALGLADRLPGVADERLILRTYVEPPFDISSYPSPLAGFRKYPDDGKRLADHDLLLIEGQPKGTLLRMAVLDHYDGMVWNAAPAAEDPSARGSFHQVNQVIDPTSGPTTLTLTVQPSYAAQADLNPWLPGLGAASEVTFVKGAVTEHRRSLRYNAASGQAVLPDRLHAQDVIRIQTSIVPLRSGDPQPYGSLDLPSEAYGFLAPQASKWSSGADTPWAAMQAVTGTMRKGYWSAGNREEERQYAPGHSVGRLLRFANGQRFVNGQGIVGSDEQYAATLALVAHQLGFPARVIFGAIIPEGGMVQGRHVTAWVEVRVADGSWQAIPPKDFIPERDNRPEQLEELQQTERPQPNVPPPNAVKPPGSIDELLDSEPAAATIKAPPAPWWERIPAVVWLIAKIVGIPVAAVVAFVTVIAVLRSLRRARRRRAGSPRTQIANGWFELLDRARDLGRPWTASATRQRAEPRLPARGSGQPREVGPHRRHRNLPSGSSLQR